MSLPARFQYALRPGAPSAFLAATFATASAFAATPFLIPEVAERVGVSVGVAGAISFAQVGAFAVATVALPRLTAPSVSVYRLAGISLVVSGVASALVGSFELLLVVRALAGSAMGALTWLAWNDAMRHPKSLGTISSVGPMTALIASPLIAILSTHGDRPVFAALALAAAPLLVLRPPVSSQTRPNRAVSRSRSNRVLLGAMTMLTFFGASLFIYESVAAREVLGLSAVAASLGFSLNAAGGLAGARLSSRHSRPGLWLASAGPAAALTMVGGHAAFFFIGLAWWGFAFWMGIPGVMRMLSARSLEPGERAGDAQAAMAAGRSLAPLLGGGFADADAYLALAAVAGTGLTVAGLTIAGVQEGRDRLPATDLFA